MIRKILVPLDRSGTAESVLSYVERFANATSAKITLVHVIPHETPRRIQSAARYVEGIARSLRGFDVESSILAGNPIQAIVDAAARESFDLIAMCSRGKSGLKRMVLGSAAEGALRKCSVPFLLVPPRLKWSGPPKFRRILVPLDGSHRAATILDTVAEFATAYGAQVSLIAVTGPKPPNLPGELVSENLIESRRALTVRGIDTDIVIRHGDPAIEILDCAASWQADLVAITTHGRTGLNRVMYGSVAETVLRNGPFPLLVKRTAAVLSGRGAGSSRMLETLSANATTWKSLGPISP